MSDEEKKAIDKLKTLIQYLSVWKENFTIVPDDVKYLIPILNLIKKQYKELEELKEDNKHQWEERCKLTFELENSTSNDKIKAKVNEVKDRPVKDEFITASQGKLNTIIDIESLLDEEE